MTGSQQKQKQASAADEAKQRHFIEQQKRLLQFSSRSSAGRKVDADSLIESIIGKTNSRPHVPTSKPRVMHPAANPVCDSLPAVPATSLLGTKLFVYTHGSSTLFVYYTSLNDTFYNAQVPFVCSVMPFQSITISVLSFTKLVVAFKTLDLGLYHNAYETFKLTNCAVTFLLRSPLMLYALIKC